MSHHAASNLTNFHILKFSSLSIGDPQAETLFDVLYDQILFGNYNLSSFSDQDTEDFV